MPRCEREVGIVAAAGLVVAGVVAISPNHVCRGMTSLGGRVEACCLGIASAAGDWEEGGPKQRGEKGRGWE